MDEVKISNQLNIASHWFSTNVKKIEKFSWEKKARILSKQQMSTEMFLVCDNFGYTGEF